MENGQEGAKDQEALGLRISGKRRKFLREFSTKHRLGQGVVLDSLLLRLSQMPEEEQLRFVQGDYAIPTDTLIARVAWADHAFRLGTWPWALHEFQELSKEAERTRVQAIQHYADFKQAFCWLNIASELRRRALAETDRAVRVSYYDAAIGALFAANGHHQQYYLPNHKVVLYNLACAKSLEAQFSIEADLDEELFRKLAQQVIPTHSDEAWAKVTRDWRVAPKDSTLQDRVAEAAGESIKYLERAAESKTPLLAGFLLEYALADDDLCFMRVDPDYSAQFTGWLNAFGKDSQAHPLSTFQNLKDRLPDTIKELIAKGMDRRGKAR
jgi:hypothetical protein